MQFNTTNITQIDPRIQFYLFQQQEGAGMPSFESAEKGQIPVIAVINDLEKWQALTEVKRGTEIKSADNEWIVTGRVPIARLEFVHNQSYVKSLKAAQPIMPTLKATLQDLGIAPDTTTIIGDPSLVKCRGEGTVVGIVDFGCDFAHQHFIDSNNGSRILSIWDQSATASPDSPYGYGRVIYQDEINEALIRARNFNTDPYTELNYNPGVESHGTHVMDIAAGSNGDKGSVGVAPNAELIFVDLHTKGPTTIEEVVDTDFGDSVRLIDAVSYIFEQAGNKPCVVNLSLGTNGGPHDGTNPVERALDALVNEKPNRAVVISASNSYDDKIHKAGRVVEGAISEIKWKFPMFDRTYNEIEIWYANGDEFELELINSKGDLAAKVPLGENGYVTECVNGINQPELVCYISHRKCDPNNKDNVIHIFHNPIHNRWGGEWTLRLRGKKVVNGVYHAWVERDVRDFHSHLIDDVKSHTLGSISCGYNSIVVGSYTAHGSQPTLSWFSSAGPTRDGRPKPEVSAPGHNVWAASSGSKNGVVDMSGTSMAAPAVTGLVACMLSLAKSMGKDMPIDVIRTLLMEYTRSEEVEWHPRYGYGRVHSSVLSDSFFKAKGSNVISMDKKKVVEQVEEDQDQDLDDKKLGNLAY